MFLGVVTSEPLIGRQNFLGDGEFTVGWVEWPEVGAEDHDREANAKFAIVVRLGHLLIELVGEILAERHVGEHALELVGVLETAGLLQLGNHGCFGFIRGGDAVNETLRQLGGVEGLEDVLVFDVLEQNHLQESSCKQGGDGKT